MISIAMETAGLMWQPETLPMEYAMATITRPKASAVPINPDTPVESIGKFIPLVDLVLVMTVQPGFGGQKFRDNGPSKIAEIKNVTIDEVLSVTCENARRVYQIK